MRSECAESASERELVAALLHLEDLALECVHQGRHSFALLMEDHAADIRAQLVRSKQPACRAYNPLRN